jgi:flagellar protein FlaG
MNEPIVIRGFGQDVAWSNRQTAADRTDAPRPDPARSEAPQAAQRLPGSGDAPADVPGMPGAHDASRDAARGVSFPQSYARFSINEKTRQISIKIVDAATDEVLREIPSEEVQRIAEDLQALARRNSIGKRPQHTERAVSGGVDRYV